MSIVESGVLKSPTIWVLLSISFLKSSKIFFIFWGAPMLGACMFPMFISSLWILPFYILKWPLLFLFMNFVLKSIFVWCKYCYPGLFSVHLRGIFFSSPSLSVCVGLLFWGESLISSMCVAHIFLSIQLLCVFWLGHLIHLHLRLLSIDTYSLPFYSLRTCVPLSLFFFLFLKQSL